MRGLNRLTICVLALLYMTYPSDAHEWYDWSCCSAGDCREAALGEIRQTPSGFEHVPSGQKLEYPHSGIKPSQDGNYHVCIPPDGIWIKGRKIKCIYVPFSS
jgi:hypothetical protein